MARDVNGNYSVPNGTAAASGASISSSAYNTFLADLAAALTDSLSRSGNGGMLAPLTFDDGSVNAPTLAFTDEPTTGIYRAASGEINVSIEATKVLTVKGTGVYSEQPHYQMVGVSYAAVCDVADDFTITGAWDFTGSLEVDGGPVLSHNDTALNSGKIFVASGTGPPDNGTGANGDFYFYY
jgi:hypothetical protein